MPNRAFPDREVISVWRTAAWILVLAAALTAWNPPATKAEIRLPAVVSDNMVLQRQSTINIWGWADPGERVVITTGWRKGSVTAKADAHGSWTAQLRTTKAGGPYSITLKGKNTVVLSNIMLGEVWLCSGQSNMEFTIKMLGGWQTVYTADKDELLKGNPSALRLFTVSKDTSGIPLDVCHGKWVLADLDAVENFSATAYFFGRELHKRLNVPIGLISTSWGGTPAEAWTGMEYLKSNSDLAFYLDDPNKNDWFPARPAVLYNAMIHPLIKFAIKGVIWYQGESNRNDALLYDKLMAALITNWRSDWGRGDLPFYFVQIAPYNYDERVASALLREAQFKTLSVPHTGMAVTMDIGNVADIHPKNKQEVGRRLALWACAMTYGVRVPAYSGPLFQSMKREGHAIRLFFSHAEHGLDSRGKWLTGFTIAGNDRVFIDANALIDGSTLVVSSARVDDPIAVRYAFTDTSMGTLFNADGLPASSFRTDDWPIVTDVVSVRSVYDSSNHAAVVYVKAIRRDVDIRYTLDGGEPTIHSPVYRDSLVLQNSGVIQARAFRGRDGSSYVARAEFVKHAGLGKHVSYTHPVDPRYPGGGDYCLVNGLMGTLNHLDGLWQGFENEDLDVTIDLGDTLTIRSVRSNYLQNTGVWIFLPRMVEYALSIDGKTFTNATTIPNTIPDSAGGAFTRLFPAEMKNAPARYVKVVARGIGTCPPWHPGRGKGAWLFVDEIIVE